MSRQRLRRGLRHTKAGVQMGGGGGGPIFLLRDDFTTAASAPLASPRTAEPGPGTLTLVQTDGEFSISSGKLVFPAQATANWGDLTARYATGFARAAGRTMLFRVEYSTLSHNWIGWHDNAGTSELDVEFVLHANSAVIRFMDGTNSIANMGNMATSTPYSYAIVLRSTGAFAFVKGGAITQWTLSWIEPAKTTATLYPWFSNHSAVGTLDFFRVLDLATPFDSDYGLATQRTASPVANDTITSEANAVIELTWVAVTGETVEVSTRRTTDNDRWILRGDQAGSTVKLIEVVAGVETERASAAQTWTNTTSYRIVVVQDGNTIRGYVANVLKWTYASAASNNTATGIKTNKAGTNLIAWPRTLTGAAAALLDAAVA